MFTMYIIDISNKYEKNTSCEGKNGGEKPTL